MIKQTKLAQVLEALEENPHLIETVQVWAQVVYPHLATPPQRTEPLIGCVNHDCAKCKPLTDDQIQKIWDVACGALPGWSRHIAYARAIEAAHGIKENT